MQSQNRAKTGKTGPVGRASTQLGLGEPVSSAAGVDRVSKPSKASSVKLRLVTVFFGGSGRSQRLEAWQAASAGCFLCVLTVFDAFDIFLTPCKPGSQGLIFLGADWFASVSKIVKSQAAACDYVFRDFGCFRRMEMLQGTLSQLILRGFLTAFGT